MFTSLVANRFSIFTGFPEPSCNGGKLLFSCHMGATNSSSKSAFEL